MHIAQFVFIRYVFVVTVVKLVYVMLWSAKCSDGGDAFFLTSAVPPLMSEK